MPGSYSTGGLGKCPSTNSLVEVQMKWCIEMYKPHFKCKENYCANCMTPVLLNGTSTRELVGRLQSFRLAKDSQAKVVWPQEKHRTV